MSKYYRVWVSIEEYDEATDTYNDIDSQPIGPALEGADGLQNTTEIFNVVGALDQLGELTREI